MVTQINLGNLFSQNGKTVLSGGQSGIDTEGLIKGLTEAKRLPAVKLEDKVKVNESKLTAFNDLKTILARFKDASNFLRNPPGVQNADQNIFQYRVGAVTGLGGVSGSSYVAATVAPGTQVQNYTINEVSQLAQAAKQESNSFTIANLDTAVVSTPALAGRFAAGTVTLKGPTPAGVNITLNDGDTLRSVVGKFNAVKDQTGISASTLQVAPGEFKIIFSATKTGLSANFDLESGTTVQSDPSGAFANLTFNTTQIAKNAAFKLDNVDIVRESNSFSDLVDGVTFTLKQPSATALNLSIEPDTELVKTGITNYVNAYNDFRLFYSRQTATDENGKPLDTATLGSNPTLRSVLDRVSAELARTVDGLDDGANKLSDLGISFTDYAGDDETPFTRNTLTYDEATLTSALTSDFDGVRKAFEFSFSSDNAKLGIFSRNNSYTATDFSISLDQNTNSYSATYDVNGTPTTVPLSYTLLSGGAVTLKGQAGTKLNGLVLVYAGSGTDVSTMNVSTSQGFGDRIFNTLDDILKDSSGSLAREITNLDESNTRYGKEITRIDEQVARYRDTLSKKYAALEAALSKVNNILQSLDAQQQAQNNN